MLDPKLIRSDLESIAKKLKTRGFELDVASLESLEVKRKAVQVETENLQSERNTKSKSIGKAKASGEDIQPLLAEVSGLGEKLDAAKAELDAVQAELDEIVMGVPNIPDDSVPIGKDENDNEEIRRWGDIKQFDFEVKDHVDIGLKANSLDFETATKLTGSRYVVLRGDMETSSCTYSVHDRYTYISTWL